MNPPISLMSDTSLVREYHRLLTEDWTAKSLDKVLDLLTKQLPPAERGKIQSETETPLPSGFIPMPVRLAMEKVARKNGGERRQGAVRLDTRAATRVNS